MDFAGRLSKATVRAAGLRPFQLLPRFSNPKNKSTMKIHRTNQLWPGLATLAGGFALFTGSLQAAPFLYAPGDLVLAFRQIGNATPDRS